MEAGTSSGKVSVVFFAEETEYEYSGSEEEDDSHGEEGEPRWVWHGELGGWGSIVWRNNSDSWLRGLSGNGTYDRSVYKLSLEAGELAQQAKAPAQARWPEFSSQDPHVERREFLQLVL